MAIVTGDRYLDLLSKFIAANTGALLDGGLVLKLNPVGLHYVQARLDALHELEALRVGAPVDYLRAYVADLGDHRALEQVRQVLRLLGSLKIMARLPEPERDPTPITLLPFPRLRSLELRGCDLSTSAARGLLELRPFLEKLICHNSADALRHIFAERTVEVQDAQVWSRLATISCFGNGMLLMDESLQLLPALETFDLSNNRFAKVANLQKCSNLTFLDVGFNQITTVANLNQILRNVKKLILRNNALVSTRGMEGIDSLEALDLSYNIISDLQEVDLLSKLPFLEMLWLEGNPVTFSKHFREEALSFFSDPSKINLDGKTMTSKERWAVNEIVRRRNRRSAQSFTPAQTLKSFITAVDPKFSTEFVENSLDYLPETSAKAKKKGSRVASIEDDFKIPGLLRRDKSLEVSYINSSPKGCGMETVLQCVEEAKENTELAVQDLMLRAELLKKEDSRSWLKHLTDLLENEDKRPVSSDLPPMLEAKNRDPDYLPKLSFKRRKKRSKERSSLDSGHFRNSAHSQEAEVERNILCEDLESNNHRVRNSLDAYGSDSETDHVPDRCKGILQEASTKQFYGHRTDNISDSPGKPYCSFKLTEELVSGKMSTSSPSSPPHFNHDLLHRRQSLERELLQLPLDSLGSHIYDSDTSSDGCFTGYSDSSGSGQHSPSASVTQLSPLVQLVHHSLESEQLPHRSNSNGGLASRRTSLSGVEAIVGLASSDLEHDLSVTQESQSSIAGIQDEKSHSHSQGNDFGPTPPHSRRNSDHCLPSTQQPKLKQLKRIVMLEPSVDSAQCKFQERVNSLTRSASDVTCENSSSSLVLAGNVHRMADSNLRRGWSENLDIQNESLDLPVSLILEKLTMDPSHGDKDLSVSENQDRALIRFSKQSIENHESHRFHPVVGSFVEECV